MQNLSVIEATGAILIARVDHAEGAYRICRWDEFWTGAAASTCRWLGADHVMVDNSGPAPAFSTVKQLVHDRPAAVRSGWTT
jgi:hypothetical protein